VRRWRNARLPGRGREFAETLYKPAEPVAGAHASCDTDPMAFEQKNMEGALFKNDQRETDNHPNMRGSCTIDGVKYWLSAWTNTIQQGDKAGERYQKLSFTRAEDQPARGATRAAAPPPQSAPPPDDDDIPF
jgi:hypothetical protein